jgi:hypothetical protein
MPLQVVGAGLGRTGTSSLRVALEQLLGGDCYHMSVVVKRPRHVRVWRHLIATGEQPEWPVFLGRFVASLDWPAAAYWREIADAHPNALVLLSTRASADEWYASFEKTILPVILDTDRFDTPALRLGYEAAVASLGDDLTDAESVKAAYDAHNAAVRAGVPADRLIEWQPGDGWEPLCTALGVPVPPDEFPHLFPSDEFRSLFALDGEGQRPVAAAPARRSPLRRARRKLRRVVRRFRG